jgi:hypothetical protein
MSRIIVLLCFALGMPFVVAAQVVPTLAASLEISASPEASVPGGSVTVTAHSYSGNPDQTTYVWSVNGRTTDQGLGRNAITVTAGPLGSATVVSVSAVEGTTDRGTASITIRPADVDILWEGATYVPPYSGILPLPNGDSPMTFVAMPSVVGADGARTPDSLIYTWRVNNSQSPALAGLGKSVFMTTPPRFANPFNVSVEVATPDGSAHAAHSITIEPATPGIVVYEVVPLLGVRFDHAIQNTFTLVDEATFEAFPLYVSAGDTTVTSSWTVNGTAVAPQDSNSRVVTLRKTGTGAGQYAIGFSFASAARMFESAQESFVVTF